MLLLKIMLLMQTGSIRVQTENIFPIIKKFLYSDHEIFVRELVSNAVDATQKLKTLSSIGEAKGDLGELRIDIKLDLEAKTLTISDKGVGMSADEVDKYINQVAFSGAEEFLDKYKGQNEANIIGHFGLGFYSGFMVSDKVEIFTKSFREEDKAVRWECDGSPEYQLEETEKAERGTDIVLYINEESKEFLDVARIRTILQKFCKFLPVPIFYEDKQINNTTPAWTKKPSELTTKDYQDFYKELYPYSDLPLFWIHLNVDYPFNLTGILYFPKIKHSYEIQKDKIQLYSNQVFVTDEVKDIVPEFLMLMHGVIDSPDIPLNVSRSYLQGDPNVRKINAHITKKVADKLEELFRNERAAFEEKWEHIGLFVKYGMMTDDKFQEKATPFHLFEPVSDGKAKEEEVLPDINEMEEPVTEVTEEGEAAETAEIPDTAEPDKKGVFYTLEEYKIAAETLQKNKEGKVVIIYATDAVQQDSYIKAAQEKGYIVVSMNTMVDAAFINNMEMKWEGVSFTRVDADIADNLVDKQEESESVLSKDETEELKSLFNRQVPNLRITVDVKGLNPHAAPIVATRPEFMRRMKDMASTSGPGASFYASMPDEVTLTVNGNHSIYKSILAESDGGVKEKIVNNLADLALLSQGLLKGNDLTTFINRSVELMTAGK
jgi:molecular chaperone HtpG